MRVKILITGGNGMLGADVVPILSEKFETVVPTRSELDVTNRENVIKTIRNGGFDWVIHLAALTDLDWCEDHVEETISVNALGTKNIVDACEMAGCRIAYISTSGVFSGNKRTHYTEDDMPAPINIYALSKYLGELAVSAKNEGKWLILRVGWLFGGGEKDKKFVGKIFNLMKKADKIEAVANIWGSPNYSVDVGELIVKFIEYNAYGLFHVANSGEPASRFDMAVAIKEFLRANVEIQPVGAEKFPTKAKRPRMEAIKSIRLEELGIKPRHWKDALGDYIKRLMKL